MTVFLSWRTFYRVETKVDDLFSELDRGLAATEAVVSSSSNAEVIHPIAASSPAQVVKRPKKPISIEQQREQTLKSLEADLFLESMQIVSDSFKFREIDPGQQEPPEAWVRDLGHEKAMERLRSAQAGWMSKKDSPVAVQVAQAVVIGISRSRASEKQGPRTLNVQVVQMSAPLPQFPELLLSSGEK